MKNGMKISIFALSLIVVSTICLLVFSKEGFSQVDPVESRPVTSGYGWSENVGWMSFTSRNCDGNDNGTYEGSAESPAASAGCPSTGTVYKYGLTIQADETIAGYAWSEHIGWISFDDDDTSNCPTGGTTCQPRIENDEGVKKMKGWAKALSADSAQGWDGWISLGTQSGGSVTYGAIESDDTLSGYPWGSDVVGWTYLDLGLDNDVTFLSCGASAGQTFTSVPNANLCSNGTPSPVSTNTIPNPDVYSWSCISITAPSVLVPCTAYGPAGTPGVCSTVGANQCVSATPAINTGPGDDTSTQVNWGCPGTDGTTASCSRACVPDGSGSCVPNTCVPVITTTQTRSIVNTGGGTCGILWTVTEDDDGNSSTGNSCTTVPPQGYNCLFDSTPVTVLNNVLSPQQNMSIGTHTLRCTNSLTSVETIYIPHPQCRLNLNYGEF